MFFLHISNIFYAKRDIFRAKWNILPRIKEHKDISFHKGQSPSRPGGGHKSGRELTLHIRPSGM